jgi:hypothetical protein
VSEQENETAVLGDHWSLENAELLGGALADGQFNDFPRYKRLSVAR